MNDEIGAVGFDLDNTLYVKNPTIDNEINNYICLKASKFLKRKLQEVNDLYNKKYSELQSSRLSLIAMGIEEDKAISIVQEALENSNIAAYLKKDYQLVDLLKSLSHHYSLFLITGSRKDIAIKKLNALGIDKKLFYPILYSDSRQKREDGAAFSHVSLLLNLQPINMMFIGDREKVDIIPAKKLGIKTAIVNSTSQFADYQLKTIYDLEEILLRDISTR